MPPTMAEVYCRMLSHDDDDSPEKCRERRRRRIQMRRLSSLPSAGTPTPLAPVPNGLREGPEAAELPRDGKRPRSSEGLDVPSLPNCPWSSSGDDATLAKRVAPVRIELDTELVYGTMSVTGRSREMEDAVDVRTPLCRPEITRRMPVHFFGVFDGHGGAHVAALLSLKMHLFMAEELMCMSHMEENGGVSGSGCSSSKEQAREEESDVGGEVGKWREAMRKAFQRADEVAVATCPCGNAGSRCSCHPMEVALGGSTAVVALLTTDHIVIGNCGDSRAVLCRGGKAVPLTRDHKPDRTDELARIQALGGRVIFLNGARVEGILAMSRAIGDKYLKPYVTAEPETTILSRDRRDEFLIIASDGLWDVLTNDLACEITSRCLKEGSPPPAIDLNSGPHPEDERSQGLYPSRSALAAALLTRLALGRKSLDNISVIVVDLKRS